MDEVSIYEILVEGSLEQRWSAWFAGMKISHTSHGETMFSGCLVDQAALHGILTKIRDLNLVLVSVKRIEAEKQSTF